MAEATTEPKTKTTRKKVPPADAPKADQDKETPTADPQEVTGNADLEFGAAPVRISSDVREIATAGGVRKCKFALVVEDVQGDPLSLGIAAAAHELANAAALVGDGRNSVSMSVARDFKTARYIIDPDGTGKGVEFVGQLDGKLKVSVNPEGKINATWSVVTKVPIADFDRLCELKATVCMLTVDAIQGTIKTGPEGQLEIH